jgi:serine/threonine protein kinase
MVMMPQDGEGSAGGALPDQAASEVSDDPLLRAAAAIPDPTPSEVQAFAAGRVRTELAADAVIAKRYRLERELGRGGMGVVWEATHLITRRRVAIKFVLGPGHVHEDLRRRFYREARAASAANHPNVIEVLDVFELDDGTPVMVMELLSGETLREKIAREGRLSVEATASILLPVVAAVGTAHALGIVHRDLKPENVFLCKGAGRGVSVKVLDFGVAKLTSLAGPDGPGEGASESDSITRTGSTLGTPCYMAPEQATGDKDVDARADVWALGVVAYECLAGARPVEGSGIGQVVMKLMTDGIKPLDEVVRGLPPEVTALVMRMLTRARADRVQDLREVEGVLARHGTPKAATVDTQSPHSVPIAPRRTHGRSLIALGAAVALGLAGFVASRVAGTAPASTVSGSAPEATMTSVAPPSPAVIPQLAAVREVDTAQPELPSAIASTRTSRPLAHTPGAARPPTVGTQRAAPSKDDGAAAASSRPSPSAAVAPRALDTTSSDPDPGGLADKPPF